jgi:DNA repair exonuclease SbcCD ATPase subunit
MITFHRVSYKNFLSTGNNPTTVVLDQDKTTLITGVNGSGKSTLMDVIAYALFNKPFRKITKPQLINTVNNKKLLVKIEFSTGGIKWRVERGMNPNVFRIMKSGKLIEQDANSKNYQEFLEKQVIKMSFKTFLQIVILGSANWTAFMSLPAADRRRVIEDLLDIKVFSIMNQLLKEHVAKNKEHQITLDKKVAILENTLKLNAQHRKKQQDKLDLQIAQKWEMTSAKHRENIELASEISALYDAAKDEQQLLREYDDIQIELPKKIAEKQALEAQQAKISEQITFYQENNSCPTCNQKIDKNFKLGIFEEQKAKIRDIENSVHKVNSAIDEFGRRIKERRVITDRFTKFSEDMQSLKIQVDINKGVIASIKEDIDNMTKDEKTVVDDSETIAKLEQTKEIESRLSEQRYLHTQALGLLKDDGIKTQIIRQYIPIMNTLINKYLERMDFFCKFEIDENFVEKIETRYKKAFTYDSFSQGEKMRIDLALLFTWREISRMRNTSPCNLLVLDEIMDSSLDDQGTDEFVAIITQLTGENNVIIISHDTEHITDKFDRVLKAVKTKNFSKIVVNGG